jgi:hypothetical protein
MESKAMVLSNPNRIMRLWNRIRLGGNLALGRDWLNQLGFALGFDKENVYSLDESGVLREERYERK